MKLLKILLMVALGVLAVIVLAWLFIWLVYYLGLPISP